MLADTPFSQIADAFSAAGLDPVAVVYNDAFACIEHWVLSVPISRMRFSLVRVLSNSVAAMAATVSSEWNSPSKLSTVLPAMLLRVRHASRGSDEKMVDCDAFIDSAARNFAGDGRLIDQAWQPRTTEGMICCYFVKNKVEGLGEQLINALYPDTESGEPVERVPKDANGEDTWVLCETNISAVYPFPDECLEPLAKETARRLAVKR